jgi:purine-binding chemotaxis protein CheW
MVDSNVRELVAFRIDTEEFAVDIGSVQEINRVTEVRRIPNVPPHVHGVINLRRKITPVVDLRGMLGFQARATDAQSRIIVVVVEGAVVGFLVDAVSEVVRLPKASIDAPPSVAGVDSAFVDGVGKLDKRRLILLNLQKMFLSPEAARVTGLG